MKKLLLLATLCIVTNVFASESTTLTFSDKKSVEVPCNVMQVNRILSTMFDECKGSIKEINKLLNKLPYTSEWFQEVLSLDSALKNQDRAVKEELISTYLSKDWSTVFYVLETARFFNFSDEVRYFLTWILSVRAKHATDEYLRPTLKECAIIYLQSGKFLKYWKLSEEIEAEWYKKNRVTKYAKGSRVFNYCSMNILIISPYVEKTAVIWAKKSKKNKL